MNFGQSDVIFETHCVNFLKQQAIVLRHEKIFSTQESIFFSTRPAAHTHGSAPGNGCPVNSQRHPRIARRRFSFLQKSELRNPKSGLREDDFEIQPFHLGEFLPKAVHLAFCDDFFGFIGQFSRIVALRLGSMPVDSRIKIAQPSADLRYERRPFERIHASPSLIVRNKSLTEWHFTQTATFGKH